MKRKFNDNSKRHFLGSLTIGAIIGLYVIAGSLIKPEKVSATKCVKLSERVSVCNVNFIKSLTNSIHIK